MKRVGLVLVFLTSIVAAIIGLGASYPGSITPQEDFGAFEGFGHDGWVTDNAVLKLKGLAPFGNHLQLRFNSWRPEAVGPAQVQIKVCGEVRAAFVIDDTDVWRVGIDGECEPREVAFDFANPFVPSETDLRQLGVQLKSAKVSSRFQVPLVSLLYIALFSLLFLLVSVLLVSAIPGSLSSIIAGVSFSVAAASLMASGTWPHDGINILSLLLVLSLFVVGLWFAALHPRNAEGRFESFGFERQPPPVDFSWLLFGAVSLVVVLGLTLRLYGISFGLPAPFHPDETPKFNAIYGMRMRGNLNPQYFLHPSLLLYCAHGLSQLLEWIGVVSDPQASIRLAGRLTSTAAGTLSIILLYLISRRLFSPFVGLVSAILLAVNPLHVTCSRYMKEDVLMLFFFLVTVLLVVKAVQQGKQGLLFIAGLTAGFCFGSKYSGLLAIIPILGSPWLRSRTIKPDADFLVFALGAMCLVPLGFVITTPYSFLDFEAFSAGISSEKRHMMRGHTVAIDAWSQYWMYHMWRSLVPGTTLPTLALSLLGIGLLAWRRKPHDLFIIALVLLYYMPAEWVKAKPAPQPERYMVPVVAFLAITCAEFIRVVANTRFRPLLPIILLIVVGGPLVRTTWLATEVVDDTRTRMAQWMIENLPQGARVAIDYPPYDPPFLHGEFQVVRFAPGKLITRLSEGDLGEQAEYLVLSSLVYDRFFSQPQGAAGRRVVIRKVFEELPILHQEVPRVQTYGFHNPTLTVFSLQEGEVAKLKGELQEVAQGKRDRTTNEIRASLNVSVPTIP